MKATSSLSGIRHQRESVPSLFNVTVCPVVSVTLSPATTLMPLIWVMLATPPGGVDVVGEGVGACRFAPAAGECRPRPR